MKQLIKCNPLLQHFSSPLDVKGLTGGAGPGVDWNHLFGV